MKNHNKFLGKKTKAATSFQNKLSSNLTGAKFRILNEKLYTINSDEAYDYFKDNKEDFSIYHEGFASQVEKWPLNPNELIIKSLKKKKYKKCIIADIGCGEGLMAKTLIPLGYKIHSFDLVALNEYITCCDMKQLTLNDQSVDIAVFCLSLMNTNFDEFIIEANRILKEGGKLVVAEINSRIVSMKLFISVFKERNFKLLKKVDLQNFFTIFTFKKLDNCVKNTKEDIEYDAEEEQDNNNKNFNILKPCLYKKR